jgi:hypothetical protein
MHLMMKQENNSDLKKYILLAQGIYYTTTGIWPVVDIESFMQVSCPKTDTWLVKTFGLILFCEGVCFIIDSLANRISFGLCLLAFLNNLSLIIVDVYYSLTNVICPIYLLDAVIQCVFIGFWVGAAMIRKRKN